MLNQNGNRKWQQEFLSNWQRSNNSNWLVEACPGAGKTRAAIEAMKQVRSTINRYFVVVPSASLRTQWYMNLEASGFDCIELPHDASDPWRKDGGSYDCGIITYQALTPEWIERIKIYCKNRNVMVVFDEVHHASEGEDSNVWGKAIYYAFGLENPYVKRRLSLSGTPFRADGQRIAFINYDSSGMAVPDTRFSFQDGVREKVVRSVFFPLQMADVKWHDGDNIVEADFSTKLNNRHSSQRYQTSIHHNSSMVSHMISAAWKQLRVHRNSKRDAGMIIFADSQDHAKQLSKIVVSVTGEIPKMVMSSDKESGQCIKDFTNSSDPIIICVAMIAEGTDIPRLTVAVYLSKRRYSHSWLWQCLGRIIRATDDKHSIVASFYAPGDDSFRDWITNVQQQVQQGLDERDKRERADAERVLKESSFVPIKAQFTHQDAYLVDQELTHIPDLPKGYEAYVEAAQAAMQACPNSKRTIEDWIILLAEADGIDLKASQAIPHAQQVEETRDRVSRLTQQYGGILSNLYGEKQFSLAAGLINKTDGKTLKDCTLSELLKREEVLAYWISQRGRLHPKYSSSQRRNRKYNDYGY